MALFSYICGQTPYKLKIPIFKVTQKQNWMSPLERTRKTGPENGMVFYASMKTSQDISSWNFVYFADSALFIEFRSFISLKVFIET